jgi:multidrug efflux pump subunit AcrA (membrane-fusion protein)
MIREHHRRERSGTYPGQLHDPDSVENPRHGATVAVTAEARQTGKIVAVALLAPDAQTVAAFGEAQALQPGMTLTANLILDRRSFFDWLLTPLNAVLSRNRG